MAFVVALFDYGEGATFGTPFKEGDVFRLIEKTNEEWWKVERKDKTIMYVPKQFVEIRDVTTIPGSPFGPAASKPTPTITNPKLVRSPTSLGGGAGSTHGAPRSSLQNSTSSSGPSLPPRRYTLGERTSDSQQQDHSSRLHSLGSDSINFSEDSAEGLHKRVLDLFSTNSLKLAIPVHKKNVALPGGKKSSARNWIQLFCVFVDNHLLFYKDKKMFEKSKGHGSIRRKNNPDKEKDFPTSIFSLEGSTVQLILDHKRKHVVELSNEKSGVIWCQAETSSQFEELKKLVFKSGSKLLDNSCSEQPGDEEEAGDDDEKKVVKKKLQAFFRRRPPLESLQSMVKDQYFGVALERLGERERSQIPLFVESIISAIEDRGLDSVGIYRLSGNASQVQKIRFKVDQEEECDFMNREVWDDINVLTGALKLFLRELPEPVIPYNLLDSFVAAIQLSSDAAKADAMRPLIQKLPAINYCTLKFILSHLARVAALGETNKMMIQNIAIVFGPTMMRKEIETASLAMEMVFRTSIVDMMLREFLSLFA